MPVYQVPLSGIFNRAEGTLKLLFGIFIVATNGNVGFKIWLIVKCVLAFVTSPKFSFALSWDSHPFFMVFFIKFRHFL